MTSSWGWEERRKGKISSIKHGEHGGQPHLLISFLGHLRFFVFCIFLFLQGIIIKGNPPFFTLFSRDWILAQEKGNGKWLWAISFVSWKADIPAGAVSASLIGIGVMQPCLASQLMIGHFLWGDWLILIVLGNLPHWHLRLYLGVR